MNTRILVVDDDPNAVNLISLYLKGAGWDCPSAASAAEAARLLQRGDISLVLLDEALPQSGAVFRLCGEQNALPVIMTNERDCAPERIAALDRGADDYLVKPFDPKEMTARVRAVLRRCGVRTPRVQCVELDNLSIDLDRYLVTYCGDTLRMPPKEIELLYYLASHPNYVFTREQLMEAVWGFDFGGTSRTVDVHIKRLRQKLENPEGPENPWKITTVWAVGYKFEV